VPVYFYVFDLLNRDGELLVNLSIERRRQLLESFLTVPKDPVRLSPLLQAPSGQVLETVRKLGLEGIVGKRIDSIYEPGERSGAWVPGARGFDALLVGVYENKQFIFAAKVKTDLCREFETRSFRRSRHCKLRSASSKICLR
jgi:bifunctional non-homologous end joining protein LigD